MYSSRYDVETCNRVDAPAHTHVRALAPLLRPRLRACRVDVRLGYQRGLHERLKCVHECGTHRARVERIGREDRVERLGREERGEARHTTYRAEREKRGVPRGGAVSAHREGPGRARRVRRSCAVSVPAYEMVDRPAGVPVQGCEPRTRGGRGAAQRSKIVRDRRRDAGHCQVERGARARPAHWDWALLRVRRARPPALRTRRPPQARAARREYVLRAARAEPNTRRGRVEEVRLGAGPEVMRNACSERGAGSNWEVHGT
jgi:hypothetical protein